MPDEKEKRAQKAQQIQAIYDAYMRKFLVLKKKQDALFAQLTKTLEQKKIQNIRKELGLE